MKFLCSLLLLSLCLSGLVGAGYGDASATEPDRRGSQREFKIQPLSLTGEKLTYEVKFSRFPIYATVGEVTFELVGKPASPLPENLIEELSVGFKPEDNRGFIHLRALAVAKGFLIRLFGVSAQDRYETLVDEHDFGARLGFKRIQEGKKNLSQTTVFDREKQSAGYSVRDFNKPQEAAKESSVKITPGTLDLLSAIYFLRLQKLKTGETLRFPLNDEGQQYDIEVVVGKTEKLKTDFGKFKTIRVEPKIFGPGKLISRPGEMTMWLTDDDRRIPLKVVAKTSSGTVTANLIRMDGPHTIQAKKK
ncbi:MAG TPA: DUF3108 domain-containing protein [Blastocatellia bacterium]|nr:DUF3108 domain-containing protein [Blastocatellia bacterium]